MYIGFHVSCVQFCQFLTKLGRGQQIFFKSPNIKLHENLCHGDRLIPCRHTDRQTGFSGRHDEDAVCFSQCFAIVPKTCPYSAYWDIPCNTSGDVNTGDDVLYMIKRTMTGRRGITMDSFKLIGDNIFQINTTESCLNLI